MNFFSKFNFDKTKLPRLPLFVYLAYLLMISLIFSSVSLAKYASYASASSSARVAAFNVSASGASSEQLLIDLSDVNAQSASCSFAVNCSAEVRVSDTVTVTLPDVLPSGIEMTMTVNGTVEEARQEGNSYIFTEDFNFNDSHIWTLTFSCNNPDLADELRIEGISIVVDAAQIDY